MDHSYMRTGTVDFSRHGSHGRGREESKTYVNGKLLNERSWLLEGDERGVRPVSGAPALRDVPASMGGVFAKSKSSHADVSEIRAKSKRRSLPRRKAKYVGKSKSRHPEESILRKGTYVSPARYFAGALAALGGSMDAMQWEVLWSVFPQYVKFVLAFDPANELSAAVQFAKALFGTDEADKQLAKKIVERVFPETLVA